MSLAAWECVPVVLTTFQFAPSPVAPGLSPEALEEAVSKCTWPPVNPGLGPEALGAAVRWSGNADESGLGPDGGEGEFAPSSVVPGLGPEALEEAVSKCTWPPVDPGLSPGGRVFAFAKPAL